MGEKIVMTLLIMSIVVLSCSRPISAQVVPQTVSTIVVRPHNIQQSSAACGPNALEYGFLGLSVPAGQVLMLTGIYWGAGAAAGTAAGGLVEATIYVTDGNPSNRRHVVPLSGITAADRLYAGIQAMPVPVPLFWGAFTHLCMERRTGIIGTTGIWIFGFFAPDT
jgi:hypothetical protein